MQYAREKAKVGGLMNGGMFVCDRIRNMGVYFLLNAQGRDLLKFLKLYYFSDRASYLDRGLTISGMDYVAREKGPVPERLAGAIEGWLPDIYGIKNVVSYDDRDNVLRVRDGQGFDKDFFSEREQAILQSISVKYINSSAEEISDASHAAGLPWAHVWDNGKGDGLILDFNLDTAIDPHTREMIEYVQSSVKKFQNSAMLL